MDLCERARRAQEDDENYGYSDKWVPMHLNEGDKLYQLDFIDPQGKIHNSNFFIDEDTYDLYWDPKTNSFDVKSYCEDSQIAPFYQDKDGYATYKNHISEYEVGEGGLDVAYGTCENNSSYGKGGGAQIYVDDDSLSELQKTNGQIIPEISNRDRWVGKIDYDRMKDDLENRKTVDEPVRIDNNGNNQDVDGCAIQDPIASSNSSQNDMSTLIPSSSQNQETNNPINTVEAPVRDDLSMDSLSVSSPSNQEQYSNDMNSIVPQHTKNESQNNSQDNGQQPQSESIDAGIER